jgi:serine/threonine protein kinase
MESMLNSRFKVKEKIGAGSFGTVFRGTDTMTNKHVAIKVEDKLQRYPQLNAESRIVKLMSKTPGFPKYYWSGEDYGHRYLVMSLLGTSLEHYLEDFGNFSLSTTLIIG